jgi:hypothetical protein
MVILPTCLFLATKVRSAASRNQKERACLEITNYKIQITNKSQITNYKKMVRIFSSQMHCYDLVYRCSPKYSCQKNKKLKDCNTKGHKEKKQ